MLLSKYGWIVSSEIICILQSCAAETCVSAAAIVLQSDRMFDPPKHPGPEISDRHAERSSFGRL